MKNNELFQIVEVSKLFHISVSIRFQGGHEKAVSYYSQLMQYIGEMHYSVAGFSKEITMIDYGLTDNVSKFVTEIQIPVIG